MGILSPVKNGFLDSFPLGVWEGVEAVVGGTQQMEKTMCKHMCLLEGANL